MSLLWEDVVPRSTRQQPIYELLLDRKDLQGWKPAILSSECQLAGTPARETEARAQRITELLEHWHKVPLGSTPHAARVGRRLCYDGVPRLDIVFEK